MKIDEIVVFCKKWDVLGFLLKKRKKYLAGA